MSTVVLTPPDLKVKSAAEAALKAAAGCWLLVAVTGQWAFAYYLATFYGRPALHGNLQAWTRNTMVHMTYVHGDIAGNVAFAAHALAAAVIAFGGALQLIPWIRRRAMALHRWNGRLFVVTSLGVSVSGLYMRWVREGGGNRVTAFGISLNAVLIIVLIVLAWRSAVRRQIPAHRRWALRAYMVANGQWFFRVGVFAWIIVNRGPVGIGKDFDGPFIYFWVFGCYLMPLLILELYLRAKEGRSGAGRLAMAGGLAVTAVLMGLGIFGIGSFQWWPMVRL